MAIQNSTTEGKTLINFSGGVNSTLMLIWSLKVNPADTIVVHYCEVKNNLNGWETKTQIVRDLIERLYTEGFKFEYIQTAVDIRNIPFSYDLVHVFGMAGAICQTNREIDQVHFGFICSEDEGFDQDDHDVFHGFDDDDDVDIIYPMFEMSRRDIKEAIIQEGYSGAYNK